MVEFPLWMQVLFYAGATFFVAAIVAAIVLAGVRCE